MLQCLKNNHFLKAPPIKKLKLHVGLWLCLLFFTTVTVVDGYAKLPDGDGSRSDTGTAGTLRRAVSDWIAAGGASDSAVYTTYGPIEDWDTSDVSNMNDVFYGVHLSATFGSFNSDISKWNMSAVTTMSNSKLLTQFHQKYLYASLLRFFASTYRFSFYAVAFLCSIYSRKTIQ